MTEETGGQAAAQSPQAIQEALGYDTHVIGGQDDKIKIGFIITLTDGTQVYPSIVQEFVSFAGVRSFVDVYIPHKYPHYKEILILPMYIPLRFKALRETEGRDRCAAVNMGYESAMDAIRRYPRAGMLHYVEMLPGRMERSDATPELYPYFTRGYVAALQHIGPGRRQATTHE